MLSPLKLAMSVFKLTSPPIPQTVPTEANLAFGFFLEQSNIKVSLQIKPFF